MLVPRTKLVAVAMAALVFLCVGCVITSAPRGWLPSSSEAPTDTYGAWADIRLSYPEKADPVRGELIAVHDDSLFVLTADTLVGLSREQLRSVRLSTYQSEHGGLASWTMLGALSTASHGVASIGTFPLWVIVGSATTASASGEPDEHCHAAEIEGRGGICWENLSKFARFPQGMPVAVDRSSLRGKRLAP